MRTDPVAISQAALKPFATLLGRYVSVVPLSTIMPFPLWKIPGSLAILTLFTVMSVTCERMKKKKR